MLNQNSFVLVGTLLTNYESFVEGVDSVHHLDFRSTLVALIFLLQNRASSPFICSMKIYRASFRVKDVNC